MQYTQAHPRGEGQRNETAQSRDPQHRQQQSQHGQLQAHSGEMNFDDSAFELSAVNVYKRSLLP